MFTGVVDADYTGTIQVLMHNLGATAVKMLPGYRVGQIVIEKYFSGECGEVLNFSKGTERGEKGFGSTGTSSQSIEMK